MMWGAGARCPPHCPLCLRSQAQLPEAPARPVVSAGSNPPPTPGPGLCQGRVWGQVTAAGLLWGAGPMPQMDVHRSHAPQVSRQLPEGAPGTSCSPRTPRGAARSRRTGPGPTAPPSDTLRSQAGLSGGMPGGGGPCGRGVTQGTGSCGNAAPSARGSDFGPFSRPYGGLLQLPDLQEGSRLPAAPTRRRPPAPIETGPGPKMEHVGAGMRKPHSRGRPLLTRSSMTVGLPRGPSPVQSKPPAVSTGLAGDEGGGGIWGHLGGVG